MGVEEKPADGTEGKETEMGKGLMEDDEMEADTKPRLSCVIVDVQNGKAFSGWKA
ncbi:hypothetical protein M407DRAFT_243770 [Tulasnella calospora MUT 4182]|uniref:Uncharacterized protein n=1 Tax=Tulasnella calospora MUT 4182 TaxID=1051891 RepID=A0A0C3LXV5_9AGAM|nr:hypothetical protein M407DRAFT_243770 [Tulasnella calospora MUT 4182]